MVEQGPRPSDKYIPWYFVAFFVVLAILDGVFVYLATTSHTGVVEENHYERGLAYNERVAAIEAQEALGWQTSLTFTEEGRVLFDAANKVGTPIEGATIEAQFVRPTQDGSDFVLSLGEIQPGLYGAETDAAGPGQWEIRVFVEWKQQQYQTSKRVVVRKN